MYFYEKICSSLSDLFIHFYLNIFTAFLFLIFLLFIFLLVLAKQLFWDVLSEPNSTDGARMGSGRRHQKHFRSDRIIWVVAAAEKTPLIRPQQIQTVEDKPDFFIFSVDLLFLPYLECFSLNVISQRS